MAEPGAGPRRSAAVLQALFVTFLWSTSWVLIKIGLEDLDLEPLSFAGLRYALAALVLLPFAGGAAGEAAMLGAAGWLRVDYLIVAGSMIAPLLQVLAQRSLPPGRIGLLFALEPVFALMFAVTVGAERFEWRWWLGALLILAALLLVEGDAARRERRRRRLSASTPR